MIRLEPRTAFLSRPTPTAVVEPEPTIEPIAKPKLNTIPPERYSKNPYGPAYPSRFTTGRFALPDYPEYEFAPDGTPYRIAIVSRRGPQPSLGELKPDAFGRYVLRKRKNGRSILTKTGIQRMLTRNGELDIEGRFTLPQFPKVFFDAAGHPHDEKTARPRIGIPFTYGAKQGRRFRIFCSATNRYEWVSDIAARRMRDGKADFKSCFLPDGHRSLAPEFPDYCVDVLSGQPLRISSPRYSIPEPMRLVPRPDARYDLLDFSGKRRTLTPTQLLAIVGIHPES